MSAPRLEPHERHQWISDNLHQVATTANGDIIHLDDTSGVLIEPTADGYLAAWTQLPLPDGIICRLHRLDGPASIHVRNDGSAEANAWAIGGVQITEQQHATLTDTPAAARVFEALAPTWLADTHGLNAYLTARDRLVDTAIQLAPDGA